MKKLLLIPFLLLTGCASNFYTTTGMMDSETGSLEIEFAKPGQATVLVNDIRVNTPSKWVKSVTIDGLYPEVHHIDVSVVRRGRSSVYNTQDSILIHPNRKSTLIVNNQGSEAGYWVTTIAAGVAGLLIADWLIGDSE